MKDALKATAIKMAEEDGLINLSREELCDTLSIAPGSFATVAGMTFGEFVEELRVEGHAGPCDYVSRGRANPELRKAQILLATVQMAKENGFSNLTRPMIAQEAGVSMPLISSYFQSLENLKNQLMEYAVKHKIVAIVAQGLGVQHAVAQAAPPKLKKEAIKHLAR